MGVCDPEAVGDDLSGVIVDVEDEREKVFARGARWVSLSSIACQPSHRYAPESNMERGNFGITYSW